MTSDEPESRGPRPDSAADSEVSSDRTTPTELDPTGVRALLAALPDPGPMPEDLVRRIEARIAEEQLLRQATSDPDSIPGQGPLVPSTNWAGGSTPSGGTSGEVISLAEHRSRRRPGRVLGIMGTAAAGLVLATVAISQLGDGDLDFADTAGMGAVSSSDDGGDSGGSADSVGGQAEAPAATHGGQDGADSLADDDGSTSGEGDTLGGMSDFDPSAELEATLGSGRVHLLPPLTDISADDLGQLLRPLLTTSAESSGDSATMTTAQALHCLDSADSSDLWTHVFAAQASYDDQPAVVIAGTDEEGAGRAWALPADCLAGSQVTPHFSIVLNP